MDIGVGSIGGEVELCGFGNPFPGELHILDLGIEGLVVDKRQNLFVVEQLVYQGLPSLFSEIVLLLSSLASVRTQLQNLLFDVVNQLPQDLL